MHPWFRTRGLDQSPEDPRLQSEHGTKLETSTAAFYSHMESMMSRLRDWPEFLQSSLSLHPKPSPDFGMVVDKAVTDFKVAVDVFCMALANSDGKFASAFVDYPKLMTSNSYMTKSFANATPSLRPQNTLRLADVASTHDVQHWNKIHKTADAVVDLTIGMGEAECLDTSDKKWRERCPSGMLNPQDSCRRWWDKFVVILVVADTLIVPFQLAYLPHKPQRFLMVTWPWFLTLFFAADMFLSFHTGYRASSKDGERPGVLVTDRAKIARRYVHSQAFLLDLVPTFPWSQILISIHGVSLFEPWKEQLVLIIGLIRLVRLLRLAKLINAWERVEESLGSVTQLHVAALLRILVTTFFFCHFNACIWWIVGQDRHLLAAFMSREANEHYEALPHWTTVERSGGPDFPSWKWAQEPIFTAYAFCCYWTLGVMRTMPSEVLPANIHERVYVMVLMFVALSLFAVSIAQVTQIFSKFTERQRTFKEELLALRLYMNTIDAPDALQEDVVSYSKHLFHRRLVNAKESGLMSRLPASLSQDLHYARVESYMRQLSTFEEWPQRSLRQVSTISEVKHIPSGTVLSQRNHEATGVWVLMSGNLEVFCPSRAPCLDSPTTPHAFRWSLSHASCQSFQDSPKNFQVSHELGHSAPLEVVDEICLTSEDTMQSTATVISSCCCEVLFIPKDGFFAFLEEQPSLRKFNTARAERLAAAGSDSDQPLLSWSLAGSRSSMNWMSAARSSVARSSIARSSSRKVMLAESGGGPILPR